jgi:hypothetical protein
MCSLVEPLSSPGYSGGHVSTVGGVVVNNLTTGKKHGSLDKAEVIHSSTRLSRWNVGDPIELCV